MHEKTDILLGLLLTYYGHNTYFKSKNYNKWLYMQNAYPIKFITTVICTQLRHNNAQNKNQPNKCLYWKFTSSAHSAQGNSFVRNGSYLKTESIYLMA